MDAAEVEARIRRLGCTDPWIRPPLPLLEGELVLEAQPDQASLTWRYLERRRLRSRRCLHRLGDRRPAWRTEGPQNRRADPEFDAAHPYFMAEYDLADRG